MTNKPPEGDFTAQEIAAVYRVMSMRRDMRHFLPDPLDDALIERLLCAAHLAPSVGLMQPWRFVRVRNSGLRKQIHALVEKERVATARALGEREDEFMRLKVEGILECGDYSLPPSPMAEKRTSSDGARCRIWTWHRSPAQSRIFGSPHARRASGWVGYLCLIRKRYDICCGCRKAAAP